MLRSLKVLFAASLALIAAWIIISACDDKPTEPVPVKEYVFYFNDASYPDRYYRYYSASKKVDSLTIPYGSWRGFAVSADGTRLYLGDGAKTVVVSSDSFEVIAEIPYAGLRTVAVSSDNEYVAIPGKDLYILRTSDYAVIHHDTDKIYVGVFSHDSKSFYGSGGWDPDAPGPPYAYRVDLSDTPYTVTRTTFPDGGVWRIVPSIDEGKWFLLLRFGTFAFSFAVYDLKQDSIIFREFLAPGSGDIELTSDGRYAFFTNPGTLLVGPPPSPFVTVFDIEGNKIWKQILTYSPVNNYLFPQNLALTPDGRKLVAEGAPGQGEFVVIDVRKMNVIEYYYLGNQVDIWDVTCQNAP